MLRAFVFIAACFVSGTEALGQPHSLKTLGAPSSVVVGTLYSETAERIVPVIDVIGTRPLDAASGWISEQPVPNSPNVALFVARIGDAKGKCAPDSPWRRLLSNRFCEKRKTDASVTLSPSRVQRVALRDPFVLLEVLNRPVTGLNYNRDAEQRIMQWRNAVVTFDFREAALALCTSVDVLTEGQLIVEGRVDRARADLLISLAVEGTALLASHTDTSFDEEHGESRFVYTITAPVVLQAEMRDLVIVGTNTYPRIDFALASPRAVAAGN